MTSVQHRARSRAGRRRRAVRRKQSRSRVFWIVAVVVVVIGVAIVVASRPGSSNKSGGSTSSAEQPMPASVVAKTTPVPESVFESVGRGSATGTPTAVSAPALTVDDKPSIVYLGAEYCPYCATERWPIVIALSRFGTFTGLKATHSSTTDVFPSTQTFSFHGATYTSPYLSFTGTELESNQPQGDGFAPLDTPTAQEQQLLDTYDKAPYIGTDSSAGGIPFIDFGGKFVSGGATYDPGVLQGKTAAEIAAALHDPSSPISKGAIGVANVFTATICSLTHNQPASVCTSPAITKLEASK